PEPPVSARHRLVGHPEDLGDGAERGAAFGGQALGELQVEVIDPDAFHRRTVTNVENRRPCRSGYQKGPGIGHRVSRRQEALREGTTMRKWWPLGAVCAGTFMLLVDLTIVNVALPVMARELNTTFSDLQWVIDLYALVLGALVLTVGAVADRLGRRRVYLTGLVLFAASSLACGLAPNVGVLIAARGVQGIGAAAMFATTMALISNTYTGRERGMAFGIWGAVNGAASAVGPIIGGLLTANFGWRWIFLVHLPVSVFSVVLTLKVVTESRDPHPRRIDVPGMVSFTVAAAALTYALIRGAWASTETIVLIAVAAAGLAAFVVAERR